MVFRNSVVGGTTLVRPAIKSPNYVAGVSGWSINADGTAEFNDVVVRGDLSSSNYVPGVAGWHLDDAGSAEFNDVTIRGSGTGDDIIIGAATEPQVRIGSTSSIGYVAFPTNRPAENLRAIILAGTLNEGAADEAETLQVFGPTVDTFGDRAFLLLTSQGADGTTDANVNLRAGSGSVILDPENFVLQGSEQGRFITTASADTAVTVETAAGQTGSLFRVLRNSVNRLEVTNGGRLIVTPDAFNSPAAHVNATLGHTGDLLRLALDSVTRALVAAEGNLSLITVAGSQPALNVTTELGHTGAVVRTAHDGADKVVIDTTGVATTYAGNSWNTYTPVVTGGGTVTWTTITGRWQRIGRIIFVEMYLQVNAAGSGATAITITGPVNIDRTIRQTLQADCDNITAAREGSCSLLSFIGGTGAVFDRLRGRDNVSVTGADLLANSIITVTGWYREA